MEIKLNGLLQERINRNRKRLGAEMYCNGEVFARGGDWDGDWQGRAILALCCHLDMCDNDCEKEKVLKQLNDIIDNLESHLNADGYFGKVFDGETVNEQQISGNSWFLRGLCEFYLFSKRNDILKLIEKICDRYLTKLKPYYDEYPLNEALRVDGGVDGHLTDVKTDKWLLSSDVGCAFMMLDGITHAYELLHTKELYSVCKAMFEKFFTIDFLKMKCQTHATLSGLRGALRFYKTTGEKYYLDKTIEIFDLYQKEGMTINYENFNWFNRPLWTEPCAIVDSLIVAKSLFEYTEDKNYLKLFRRIYLNAISSAQRINGGAGCQTCLDEKNDILKVHLYEAFFCCTMRLAEGLRFLKNNVITKYANGFLYNLPENCALTTENGKINVKYEIKESGKIISFDSDFDCTIYIPTNFCVSSQTIKNNSALESGKEIYSVFIPKKVLTTVEIKNNIHCEVIKGRNVYFNGDTILTEKIGIKDFHCKFETQINGRVMSPIFDCMDHINKESEESLLQKI